ncbi:hypothetical protein L1049_011616 [Liquidambar formosana]|uniref:CASP-like protein n=1 Tax=Liquidambar formosana TaxID=63359 RepID=A0AAP0WX55_LIQFO
MEAPPSSTTKPTPSSTTAPPIINLLLRVLTFIFLFVSLIVLTTATATLTLTIGEVKFRFKDVYAYRVDKFFSKGSASASMLLLGFLCAAVSSVFSSLALPKKD